jgi:hypothetical protein
VKNFGVQPQHVRSRLSFEADRFRSTLGVQDRSLAVGIGDPQLGFAIRPRDRLLCLEADAVDRVLRRNGFVFDLDRRLDRGAEVAAAQRDRPSPSRSEAQQFGASAAPSLLYRRH